MTEGTVRFYFANLGADILRCALALEEGNQSRYKSSLARARRTLAHIRKCNRPEAYEEGLLLLRAAEHANSLRKLPEFRDRVNRLIAEMHVT